MQNRNKPIQRKVTLSRKTNLKRVTPLKKETAKHRAELNKYRLIAKQNLEENPLCQLKVHPDCQYFADQNQHTKGRGIYLLDKSTLLTACTPCHRFINEHPALALELNLASSRLNTNSDEHVH